MAIRGSLQTMSTEDLLDWIEKRNLVGRLSVHHGNKTHEFHFDSGAITLASCNLPGQQLSQLLLSRHLVEESQLQQAFEYCAATKASLGQALLEQEWIAENLLQEVLEIKVREAIWDVLSWEEGRFEFNAEARSVDEFPIAVMLGITLELGKRQVERWRSIRKIIPDESVKLWVSDHYKIPRPEAGQRAQVLIRSLVDCVQRGLSVNQIILEHHGRRFQVLSQLSEFIEGGALSIDKRSVRRSPKTLEDVRVLEVAAIARAKGGKKKEALSLCMQGLVLDPGHEALQALSHQLERALVSELSQTLLSTYQVPVRLKNDAELQKTPLSDHEKYILGRIDGVWDILSLVRLAPMREVDALVAFQQLREQSIISL